VARRGSGYVGALDGLRGLAALIVVLAHTTSALAYSPKGRLALFQGPLAPLLNADGAVQLFFVLSGFVLAGSLGRNRAPVDLLAYWVKRVFRIHPPYVAALLFAWLASFHYVRSPFRSWLNRFAGVHLDPQGLLASLRFPGSAFDQLPVGWTLEVEMIFSLLLPALWWVARRGHWSLVLAAATGLLFAPPTYRFAVDFALGLALWCERERLARWVAALPRAGVAELFALALCAWVVPLWLGWSLVRPRQHEALSIAVMGLGAAGLVALAAWRAGPNRLLSLRPVAFLGRISYSVYLVHFPVLLLAAPHLAGPPRPGVLVPLFAAVVVPTLALAWLGHRLVEVPSIRAGNRICASLARRAGSAGVASRRGEDG
jgi:peptidoglycan/LPS O-acetylase OafA/YrhL